MTIRTSHDLGGKELLGFVESCASVLHDFRGFEMSVIRILLHLGQVSNGELFCARGELSFYSGMPESTSLRLLKIMHDEDLVFFKEHENCNVSLSLNTEGRKFAQELQGAFLRANLQAQSDERRMNRKTPS